MKFACLLILWFCLQGHATHASATLTAEQVFDSDTGGKLHQPARKDMTFEEHGNSSMSHKRDCHYTTHPNKMLGRKPLILLLRHQSKKREKGKGMKECVIQAYYHYCRSHSKSSQNDLAARNQVTKSQ